MRKIIISFCILFAALSLQAQSVNGIRIDGGNTPILVYLGGNQICLPTTTCFIANLNPDIILLKCLPPALPVRESEYGKEKNYIKISFILMGEE